MSKYSKSQFGCGRTDNGDYISPDDYDAVLEADRNRTMNRIASIQAVNGTRPKVSVAKVGILRHVDEVVDDAHADMIRKAQEVLGA